MLSFKRFLIETLTDPQRRFVDGILASNNVTGVGDPSNLWGTDIRSLGSYRPKNFSDHLFDEKNPLPGTRVISPDTLVFDYKPESPFVADTSVHNALFNLGYKIHDYGKGLAVREGSTRPISIGKILSAAIPKLQKPVLPSDEALEKEAEEYVAYYKSHPSNVEGLHPSDYRDPDISMGHRVMLGPEIKIKTQLIEKKIMERIKGYRSFLDPAIEFGSHYPDFLVAGPTQWLPYAVERKPNSALGDVSPLMYDYVKKSIEYHSAVGPSIRALHHYTTSEIRNFINNKDNLEILITRDPYKVAEMSTNKSWTSCLTLGSCLPDASGMNRPGSNVRFVRNEIKSGVHVAYLIKKGDYDLQSPFARISLRPYHSSDISGRIHDIQATRVSFGDRYNPGMPVNTVIPWHAIKPEHTILRPSQEVYLSDSLESSSAANSEFQDTVSSFLKAHMPSDVFNTHYFLDPLSYGDGDPLIIHSRDDNARPPSEEGKITGISLGTLLNGVVKMRELNMDEK